jgi:hypothetical protein
MRIDSERKLFVGIKVDNKMRDQLRNCPPRDKHYVDGSDPQYLFEVRTAEETFIGKQVDGGTPAVSMDDIKRNILSILNRVAPGRHREDAIKVFALDEADAPLPPGSEGGDEPPPERDFY